MADIPPVSDPALLQTVIDSIPDIIFYKDLGGIYRAGNQAWGKLLGRPVSETLGKSDYDLFPHDIAAFFKDKDAAMLAGGQSRRNEEWLDYPDGRRVLVDTLKAPVVNRNGQLIGLVGVCRDITARSPANPTDA
jgi:PAS domain S-box-containing protein